ncbi:MAG: DEAD/DEAH box helicase [Acidimicrobiales bacterium]
MTYPSIDRKDFLEDLLKRKEFYSLKLDEDLAEMDDMYKKHFKIHTHQLFVRNFLNPNTPYKRLYLCHGTGTGKTIAAIFIATTFIKEYTALLNDRLSHAGLVMRRKIESESPNVFVLGFKGTKTAFKNELLKHTEFGFINYEEKAELNKRKLLAERSNIKEDIQHWKEYESMLKKRIHIKIKGGFYRFYGYDEFINKLFVFTEIIEEDIENKIKTGQVKINKDFLNLFKNSLLICDEVHNTYNMVEKNSRGIALQYVLDNVESLRAVFMSATPINNRPTEIIEIANYLLPKDQKLKKNEYFLNNREMHKGKLQEIGTKLRGYVSFLRDTNVKYFPQKIFVGNEYKLDHDVENMVKGQSIKYLSFVECPMSEMHQKAYVDYGKGLVEFNEEEEKYTRVPSYAHTLFDMVFPGGVFKTQDIAKLEDGHNTDIMVKKNMAGINIFYGPFLDKIELYSSKYKKLIDNVLTIIKTSGGKMMIYHNHVKNSGILLIQELLKANGILDEYSDPIKTTICSQCAECMEKHGKNHNFTPARFIMAYSKIEKGVLEMSLERFNLISNANGINYSIILGSKIIQESYDFKDIRHLFIVSVPISIPHLEQIIGRTVRKNSHINLPVEDRVVKIYLMISNINKEWPFFDAIGPELYRYIIKMIYYDMIQIILRELNKNAIDANLYSSVKQDELGNLPFTPALDLKKYKLSELNLTTYTAYHYYVEEINMITLSIKRLFVLKSIYTYNELWHMVQNPPFKVEINSKLFSENNFIIALHNMSKTYNYKEDIKLIQAHMFDPNDRFIIKNNNAKYQIEHIGKYYILFPYENIDAESYLRENTKIQREYRFSIDNAINKQSNYEIYKLQFEKSNSTMSIFNYNDDFQYKYMQNIIKNWNEFKHNKDSLQMRVLKLFDDLGVIVWSKYVKNYKDVAKYIKADLFNDNIPIGLILTKYILMYDGERWREIDKMLLNLRIDMVDNKIVVGYIQNGKFKIRSGGIEYIENADNRKIERGIICTTKNKHQLIEILEKLGVNTKYNKVENICISIRNELIKREMIERHKDTHIKWFYFWMD